MADEVDATGWYGCEVGGGPGAIGWYGPEGEFISRVCLSVEVGSSGGAV